MGRFQVSLQGIAGMIVLVGFDLAVIVRAYQQGRLAGSASSYLVGFGLVLLVFHWVLLQVGLAAMKIRRSPPGDRWVTPVSPMLILALYLAVLTLPILATLFLRPGTF